MNFSWTFPGRQEKGPAWYAAAGACLTAFVVWGFLWDYPFMSVVALIFAGVYLFMDNDSRGDVRATVDERGVEVAGLLHEYAAIQSFSVIYEGNRPVLLRLKVAKRATAQVDAQITDAVDVPSLRAYLSRQVTEGGATEFGLVESLLRRLKI